MRRFKVLFVASWYPSPTAPAAGAFVAAQARALSARADVAVLHVQAGVEPYAPRVEREGELTVVRVGIRSARPLGVLARYARAGERAYEALRSTWGSPDIVHVQALWPAALVARRLSRRHGIPYVVTEHSEEYLVQSDRRLAKYPAFVRFVLRPLAHGASRTIAVSRFLSDRLGALGLTVRSCVIPNVVATGTPAPPRTEPPHIILHVSVMGPAKDLPGLIAAVGLLGERRDDFIVHLVGDGECRAEAQALVSEKGLDERVRLLGLVAPEKIAALLADAAFTVVSSTHETFSVSAAESLMAGRPVVSTRCGGPEEFITAAVGELVAAGDPQALADGMDRMLDTFAAFDPAALNRYAVERFSPDVVAAQMLTVYREVLSG